MGTWWIVVGSLWIVVGRCGLLWVVPGFSDYVAKCRPQGKIAGKIPMKIIIHH